MEEGKANPKTMIIPTTEDIVEEIVSRDEYNNEQVCRSSSTCYTFPDPINESNHGIIQVLGSCEGLVLISFYDFSYICIINPTTREHRTLSPSLLQLRTNQPGTW
ncbi:unnamed protein product [Arabis nemorensis]|uniref:Uncharacterized protein n=1 Tax=Arabis nemorensis TaxID=586526 RepID=A0A565CVY7_9BRAS|nr:unnamed protein product [Arabis nemorensis]